MDPGELDALLAAKKAQLAAQQPAAEAPSFSVAPLSDTAEADVKAAAVAKAAEEEATRRVAAEAAAAQAAAAQAAAAQAAEEATAALRSLRESLLVALGPAVEAAKVLAVQQRVAGGIQQPVAGGAGGRGGGQQGGPQQKRAATHQGTSYQGFLLYLREQRARLRSELPSATSTGADSCRAVERLAAQGWELLEAPLKLEVGPANRPIPGPDPNPHPDH